MVHKLQHFLNTCFREVTGQTHRSQVRFSRHPREGGGLGSRACHLDSRLRGKDGNFENLLAVRQNVNPVTPRCFAPGFQFMV